VVCHFDGGGGLLLLVQHSPTRRLFFEQLTKFRKSHFSVQLDIGEWTFGMRIGQKV
jgi:hypothetical protein